MTPHLHREYVEGCYRCDLGRDEEARAMKENIRANEVVLLEHRRHSLISKLCTCGAECHGYRALARHQATILAEGAGK